MSSRFAAPAVLAIALGCAASAPRSTEVPAPQAGSRPLAIASPRVEFLVRPIGLGTRKPRFSWQVAADARAESQTAYRLLVATNRAALAAEEGDLWDSGKVTSDASTFIEYAGAPLPSRAVAFWSVRVWNRAGQPSPWIAPETFELGLLADHDWQARWIGPPPDEPVPDAPPDLAAARWIWCATQAAACTLRHGFEIPAHRRIARARLFAGADDRAGITLNGREVGRRSAGQESPVLDVRSFLTEGKNVIGVAAENDKRAAGFIARLDVEFVSGPSLSVVTDGSWRASDRKNPVALARGFDDRGWPKAKDLAAFGADPFSTEPVFPPYGLPAPALRKTFALDGDIERARVYLAGLGYYDLFVNGRRIGDQVLDPGFTAYDKRVLVVAHDVTAALRQGDNALGVILGNGFFHPPMMDVWNYHQAPWRASPRLLLQLHVRYRDGREAVIASDGTWTRSPSPILFDGTRNGESYDARLAHDGFARPGADPPSSHPVAVVEPPRGRLVAQEHPPIRVTDTRKPIAVTQPSPGVFVFDLGQSIAGWARLHASGPAGTRIRLRYGERVSADGSLDTQKLTYLVRTGRFQTDEYVLAGERGGAATETWEPRFAYHGFRYVEMTGYPGTPTVESLDGRVVHTDFERGGGFSSGNSLLDAIQAATLWSYRGNFVGIPTDCPHREKNGWTGDAHLAIETAFYNFGNGPAYRKWTNDLLDAQRAEGDLPGIVPAPGWGYGEWSGPSWEAALFLIPWALYEFEGDREILQRVYPAWTRYLDYLQGRAKDDLVDIGLGDWVPLATKTPVVITSTGYYYRLTALAARVARTLGKPEEARRYRALADRIGAAFRARFVDRATGRVAEDQQTALAAALDHGLVLPEDRPKVAKRLADAIVARGYHLDTGVLGAKYALRALADNGYPDVAYRVASQSTFPSWGYWMTQGATTLWEDWGGGISRNHIFFGDISAWFYRVLAGIRPDPDEPGFRHVLFAPYVPADLDHAEAVVATVRGPVESRWRKEGAGVRFWFALPVGSRATVALPAVSLARVEVTVGAEATQPGRVENGRATFALESGRYEFLVRD